MLCAEQRLYSFSWKLLFISSSPELAMPSTLAPDRLGIAVVGSSRERPGHPDRVRLRCPKSFAPSDFSDRTFVGGVPVVAHWVMS